MLDWQLTAYGPAAFDLTYFLMHLMETDIRREAQEDILAAYLNELHKRWQGRLFEIDAKNPKEKLSEKIWTSIDKHEDEDATYDHPHLNADEENQ